ncbi:sensor histidine kinase [Microbacterium lacus]|uniref:sensor histidine kinase n=1 Tax=Microbacterium lacus TaxID=415217 RepID=UPI000C2BC798|nr:HAMP domain-containing sensor histidine kinase [Microbacterium lacus]
MSASESAEKSRKRTVFSVRTRIIAVITIVSALGLISVGAAVYMVERARIIAQIDDRLAANLDSARYLVSQGNPETGTWASSTEALTTVVQRMSPDDNTGALGVIEGQPALAPGVALDVDLSAAPGFVAEVTEQSADGRPVIGTYVAGDRVWRYLAAPITVPDSPAPETALFTMAYDVEAELAEINVAAQVYLLTGAIALVVIAGVAWLVATRLLRPLRQMRETADRVSANSLSERLPIQGRDDVSELAATMNAMLDRLDDAVDSQRRLLHDIGHELKTPITIVRGYVEVMDPTDPEDVRETQALAVDELDRMGQLVQDLARSASLHGASPISPRPVDVADLTRQVVRKAEGIAGATVRAGSHVDIVAALDSDRITQALLQLAQNAVTHGDGSVEIGSSLAGPNLEFTVRDHGPGVPLTEREKVFERFYRGEEGRDASTGSGLGLNIVQVIARAHGGSARVEEAEGGGALFVVSVPLRRPVEQSLAPSDVPPRPPVPPLPFPFESEKAT